MFFIFAAGLPWSLTYTNTFNRKFLSVFLEPYNSEKTHWEVDTEFQITLLNQAGKDHLMTKRRQHTFSDEDDEDIGFRTLKLFKDLEGEGFIKDNKIQLKVELIAEKLVRNDLLT